MGRTHRNFNTRINEHLGLESSSIYKHLNDPNNGACKTFSTKDISFRILDNGRTDYELAVKEGIFIKWLHPALNKQKSHEVITLSI